MTPHCVRIDDRLVHGQVLVAWAGALRPDRILLASDAVAADPQRRALYLGLADDEQDVGVADLAAAAVEMRAGVRRLLVVCASPADVLRLVELGAPIERVHIGGMHAGGDKRAWLPYVHLSAPDVEAFRCLLARGVQVEARDLPSRPGVALDAAVLARFES